MLHLTHLKEKHMYSPELRWPEPLCSKKLFAATCYFQDILYLTFDPVNVNLLTMVASALASHLSQYIWLSPVKAEDPKNSLMPSTL